MLHVMSRVVSRDLQIFQNTDTQKLMEKFSKMRTQKLTEKWYVFKDCKAERDCKFLVKISSRLYKIVKSCGPLASGSHMTHKIDE